MAVDSSGKEGTLSMCSLWVRIPLWSPSALVVAEYKWDRKPSRYRLTEGETHHAAIAQMVERLPCKQDAPSSILGGGTRLLLVSIVVMQSADNRLRGVQFTHEQPNLTVLN